jgi:hypothetical protein
MITEHRPIFRLLWIAAIVVALPACNLNDDFDPAERSRDLEDTGEDALDTRSVSDATDPDATDATELSDTGDASGGGDVADASDAVDGADTSDAGGPDIWTPAPGATWHWQLQGTVDLTHDVEIYDIDLFDVSLSSIDQLQARGVKVVCYFSAGSYEDWRDDATQFEASDYGEPVGSWDGEWWLDIRSQNVRQIMEGRLDLAKAKGCDAVEPDNIDGFQSDTGFPLNQVDQLDYNRFLANQAHLRGLSIGLKNAVELIGDLEDDFDWAINESCLVYNECARLQPFLNSGKAVLHAEYVDDPADGPAKQSEVCAEPSISGFSTKIFTWDLDGWSLDCPQ